MEIDINEAIVTELKTEINELREKNDEYFGEIQRLRDELCEKQNEVIKYMEWYDTIRNSTIWKMTKPLRMISDSFRRNKNS